MKKLKDWAYRLGVFLVNWSCGPTGQLRLYCLPLKPYQYDHLRDRAALQGLTMEELPDHLIRLFIRESEAELYRIKTSDDLFPNHKK